MGFVTNTNWKNYSGESTMGHPAQMAGLAVQNFVSAAVGLAVAIALIRGLIRRRSATIGNFWVDITRSVTRILLPLSMVFTLLLVSQGVTQNLYGTRTAVTVEGASQSIPGGPVASPEAIKELGTNGGAFYNANSSHPFENPNPFTDPVELWLILSIPFALTFTFGTMARDRRQGWVIFAAMFALWLIPALLTMAFENGGQQSPRGAHGAVVDDRGVDRQPCEQEHAAPEGPPDTSRSPRRRPSYNQNLWIDHPSEGAAYLPR